jgi:A/G-specific adenine glycosylase
VRGDWWPVAGSIVHVFTHFRLELTVYRALVRDEAVVDLWAEPERCRWVHRRDLDDVALPSVMRKVIAHGVA